MYNIYLIVCMDMAGAIGFKNDLLFRLREDLKLFKEITTGHSIIMGRKTFESIGKPLPNRQNIVLSKQNIQYPGILHASSIEEALEASRGYSADKSDDVFVIGGEQIYRGFLPMAKGLYITHVPVVTDEADTFFPEFRKDFKPISSKIINVSETDILSCSTWPESVLQVYYQRI